MAGLELVNERGLQLAMRQTTKKVDKAGQDALKKAGITIVADAQRNIRTAGYQGGTLSTTGRLMNSGRTIENSDESVDAGFFSEGSADGSGYAAAVEYGRRPGRRPPIVQMRAWVRKKLRVAEDDIESAAFLVARKIGRKGTSPHPFFTPAVAKNRDNVIKAISTGINKATR